VDGHERHQVAADASCFVQTPLVALSELIARERIEPGLIGVHERVVCGVRVGGQRLSLPSLTADELGILQQGLGREVLTEA